MKIGLKIVLFAIIVLLIVWYFVSTSNEIKTKQAVINQQPANPNITGKLIADATIPATDYTEIVSGKIKWIWSGNSTCPAGYEKITSGQDKGWCKLIQ